jgi:hypothetical protein
MSESNFTATQTINRLIDRAYTADKSENLTCIVPSLEDLDEYLNCTYDLIAVKGIADESKELLRTMTVGSSLQHERSHASAVHHIGGTVVGYALEFHPQRPGQGIAFNAATVWRPSRDLVTPPLAYAAVDIHPIIPSPSDMKDMHSNGFPDIGTTIRAILTYNEQSNVRSLPVPRSYALGVNLAGLDDELTV